MNRKICILAPVHIYSDVRVFQKEAKTLAAAGYDVYLIAVHSIKEKIDNVNICPVPNYKTRMGRFILQPWFLWTVLSLRTEAVHLHNPDTLFIGFILKLFNKKVVYDTHEDFTQRILIKQWIPRYLRKMIAAVVGSLERIAGHSFDVTIATQPDVAERLGNKTVIIENAPITTGEIVSNAYLLSEKIERTKEFTVVYVGAVNEERGLFEMVNAMEIVNQNIKAKLWLIGPIDEENDIIKAKKLNGWKYVDYFGRMDQEVAFSYIIKADAGLIVTLDIGGWNKTNPNKLFEYQIFGVPFIASDFPYWKEQVHGVQSGIFIKPNAQELSKALLWLANNPDEAKKMGKVGQDYMKFNYNWELESKKLLQIYERLFA